MVVEVIVMKIKKNDILLFAELRKNARESLTRLSKKTRIPVSTIYDKLKYHTGSLIKKHCALLDFSQLGFPTKTTMLLKSNPEKRKELLEFLKKNRFVNTLLRINNDYDFFVEAIFRNMKESEDFVARLEEEFGVINKKVCYVVDEIKKEEFLSDPLSVELLTKQ